jgi:hypothetical protein
MGHPKLSWEGFGCVRRIERQKKMLFVLIGGWEESKEDGWGMSVADQKTEKDAFCSTVRMGAG